MEDYYQNQIYGAEAEGRAMEDARGRADAESKEQFTEEERTAINETAEMIFNFKIGDNLQNLIGTLESFLLVRVNAARKEERERLLKLLNHAGGISPNKPINLTELFKDIQEG